MAEISKNARTGTSTQHFRCSCGGEVKMKRIMANGKVRAVAQCTECDRTERKPSLFYK
jgi:hypothetical protein